MKIIKLEDMGREGQIDFFIQQMGRNGHEHEVALILSTYIAYKNYGYDDVDKIKDEIYKGIMNIDCGYVEEEAAWNKVIDTLGVIKVLDIIENIDDYMNRYCDVMVPLGELKDNVLKIYCEI